MTIKPLSCPRCGSPDLEERTWNRRRCRHCGTESVLSSDRTRLQLVEWVCPSCGFNNESGTAFCGQCGAELTKKCPECSRQIRIDLQFCSFCGANYEAVLAKRRGEEDVAALKRWREGQVQRAHSEANWLLAKVGFLVWFVLFGLLGALFGLLGTDAAVISTIPALGLAALIASATSSRRLARIDLEFRSKKQALQESLAQEYAEMGLSEEGSQPSS